MTAKELIAILSELDPETKVNDFQRDLFDGSLNIFFEPWADDDIEDTGR